MSASTLGGQEVDTGRPRHAGVWVRTAGNLIDIVAMVAPVTLIIFVIVGFEDCVNAVLAYLDPDQEAVAGSFEVLQWIGSIVLAAITVVLWVNWDGRTPGKKLMRIKIVSYPDYQTFSYGIATLRMLLHLTGALTFFLGYVIMAVMIASREDKRAYHDLISRTCVIHDR